jgi:hypothetical protein
VTPTPQRVFLLSPAFCGGRRGQLLLSERGQFPLADGVVRGVAPLGEVFTFLSGLYFKGKLSYARSFAAHPDHVYVITPTRGLQSPDLRVGTGVLREFAVVDVSTSDARYRDPLERDARALQGRVSDGTDVVLLGSIATGKYVDALAEIFGTHLRFPVAFVGRGDMSRGALLLRAVRDGRELEYAPVLQTPRHGRRAPRIVDTP